MKVLKEVPMPTTIAEINRRSQEQKEYIGKIKAILLGIFQKNPALQFTQEELREAFMKAPEVRRFPWYLCFLNWILFDPHFFNRVSEIADALDELIEEGEVQEWREGYYGLVTLGERLEREETARFGWLDE